MRVSESGQRNQRGDARRAELLDAGRQLFGSRSFDEVSIEEITAEAGAATGLISYHFGGKKGLFIAVVESFFKELRTLFETNQQLDVIQRAKAIIHQNVEYARNNPARYRTFVTNSFGTDPDRRLEELHNREYELIISLMIRETIGAEPSPLLRVALRGWLRAQESIISDWLPTGSNTITQQQLEAHLLDTLTAAFESALKISN